MLAGLYALPGKNRSNPSSESEYASSIAMTVAYRTGGAFSGNDPTDESQTHKN